MRISANATTLRDIVHWREMYRVEMACQVVKDSVHAHRGLTDEYMLLVEDTAVGYGSIAVGGPWKDSPTAYEFYVAPQHRLQIFRLFQALLDASGATTIHAQSNDVLATTMLHTFAGPVTSKAILFHDGIRTEHRPPGATFRVPAPREAPDASDDELRWRGVAEVDGQVAASGGILFHYNRPYGDIYMETAEPFRRRGLGAFVVQELKRVCYENGHVPAARCNTDNVASQRTLQRAGFVPCGHILQGAVRSGTVGGHTVPPW
jgi:GNAT superfamily N-acetyltransferase